MKRKVKIVLSGVGSSSSDLDFHDGKMKVNYLYLFNNNTNEIQDLLNGEKQSYGNLLNVENATPIVFNYAIDESYKIYEEDIYKGIFSSESEEEGGSYSYYRREYQKESKFIGMDTSSGKATPLYENYTIIGEWQPVAIDLKDRKFRDYNIVNGMSYQYVMYSRDNSARQCFANAPSVEEKSSYGTPVKTTWRDWSITELIPTQLTVNAPAIQKAYRVDDNNIWFFKYDLEVGSQTQNIVKNEIQTLGRYSRVSQTPYNAISGDVSCMLGSEIIPYTEGYIERMYQSIEKPLSVNEKIIMLKKWRQLVSSKNPKLLKDQKGQSWIVQIFNSSNTPLNNIRNQPDKISFSWKEIESTDKVIIYGGGKEINRGGLCSSVWSSRKEGE